MAVQDEKKVFNTPVIDVDINDEKLALAKEVCADYVINGSKEDPDKKIMELSGIGAHISVVTAVSNVAFNQAIDSARPAGRVVAVGLPSETMDVSIVATVLQGIELIGSLVGTREDLKE
ncbi:zinc-binding dehydrogenase, partial [Streptobacillus moniliformis]|uniref:zinc-binding dehydrogenase n=1 Tax=Streptobacillus moniliformis TaxID=34105 RepID=UPI0027D1F7B9